MLCWQNQTFERQALADVLACSCHGLSFCWKYFNFWKFLPVSCSCFQVDPLPPGVPKDLPKVQQLHHWSWCLHQCCNLLEFTSKRDLRIHHYKICISLRGARATNKDHWEMTNAYVLHCTYHCLCWCWESTREEKGFICQEEMQSWLWLGVINSMCCSEIWLCTGHIPLISLQHRDPSGVADENKSHSLYHLHCKWG